ncbi:hypothetical protein IAT40_000003 [Kwoniella sp. CBS 6097]
MPWISHQHKKTLATLSVIRKAIAWRHQLCGKRKFKILGRFYKEISSRTCSGKLRSHLLDANANEELPPETRSTMPASTNNPFDIVGAANAFDANLDLANMFDFAAYSSAIEQ